MSPTKAKSIKQQIQVGTKVQRTSVTGLVMVNTVVEIKRIGTVIYAKLDNGILTPVKGLQVVVA